jgi:hypothetical protein
MSPIGKWSNDKALLGPEILILEIEVDVSVGYNRDTVS